MSNYSTNFSRLISDISRNLFSYFIGSWKTRAVSLISLLTGFYVASSLLAYLLNKTGYRVFVVIELVVFMELLVRVRNIPNNGKIRLIFKSLDNIRIGITYAIVLEAFKLGS